MQREAKQHHLFSEKNPPSGGLRKKYILQFLQIAREEMGDRFSRNETITYAIKPPSVHLIIPLLPHHFVDSRLRAAFYRSLLINCIVLGSKVPVAS